MYKTSDCNRYCYDLMKIDVVIKREDIIQSRRSKHRDRVAADGKENERHVQFQRLGSALRDAYTIAHNFKCCSSPVLIEFPSKK